MSEGPARSDIGARRLINRNIGHDSLGYTFTDVEAVSAEASGAMSVDEAVVASRQMVHREIDIVADALAESRSVYRELKIPTGARFWKFDEDTGRYVQDADGLGAVEEYELWERLGHEEGGRAWAAGDVIRKANSVSLLLAAMTDEAAKHSPADLQGFSHALTLQSFWLGCAIFRLGLLSEAPGSRGSLVSKLERLDEIRRNNQNGGRARARSLAQLKAPGRLEALRLAQRMRADKPSTSQKLLAEKIKEVLGGRFPLPEHEAICGWIRSWEAAGDLSKKEGRKN